MKKDASQPRPRSEGQASGYPTKEKSGAEVFWDEWFSGRELGIGMGYCMIAALGNGKRIVKI